jgi:hypothetical protein
VDDGDHATRDGGGSTDAMARGAERLTMLALRAGRLFDGGQLLDRPIVLIEGDVIVAAGVADPATADVVELGERSTLRPRRTRRIGLQPARRAAHPHVGRRRRVRAR